MSAAATEAVPKEASTLPKKEEAPKKPVSLLEGSEFTLVLNIWSFFIELRN